MKKLMTCLMLAMVLVACGKTDEKAIAKAKLQEKADALARSAATNMQPPPAVDVKSVDAKGGEAKK